MGSRREEERNEKIIRGLMKLPPNRRCIICNSLGPQYVCTNFWTFVCMACSGIHREFTHRVKSVSMAKFTSQEVEALQNGGNQRAREIYLKSWDPRQRLPDSSNADRVREFIKSVYVEKKYAAGKISDKPPRDIQRQESSEDVTKRSSSYHSYSQSPPYDYQYEERRYGKRASAFVQKSGSAHGALFGKASSFVYSPGRYSDHIYEDRFANEGSSHRASDFSVSSGGDPFRSAADSPTSQKELGFNSPPFQPVRSTTSEIPPYQMTNLFPDEQPQRTTSFGNVRPSDGSSSIKSYNINSLVRTISGTDQAGGTQLDKPSALPPSPLYGGLDLFETPKSPELNITSTSSIDLFQLPGAPSAQSTDVLASLMIQTSSIDLFAAVPDQQPHARPSELSVNKNEGWATFDSPQPAASSVNEITTSSEVPSTGDSSAKSEGISLLNTNMNWPPYPSSTAEESVSSMLSPWHQGLSGVLPSAITTTAEPWNAYDDGVVKFNEQTRTVNYPSPATDQLLGFRVFEHPSNDGQPPGSNIRVENRIGELYAPSEAPVMEETWKHNGESKSTNPFDLPYDTELEESNMFLDVSSLQAALPNIQAPPSFLSGVGEQWFPNNPVTSYIPGPAGTEGGLAFMSGQAPSSQLPNVQAQEPIASTGGNPFA